MISKKNAYSNLLIQFDEPPPSDLFNSSKTATTGEQMISREDNRIHLITQFDAAPLCALLTNTPSRRSVIVPWPPWSAIAGPGRIPYFKDGRRVLYRKADILAWLEQRTLQTFY